MKRTFFSLGALSVGLLALSFGPGPTTAQGADPQGPSVSIRTSDSFAGETVPQDFARSAGKLADLVDFNDGVLAGSYYANGRLFIGSTGSVGDALVRNLASALPLPVEVIRANHSLIELKQLAEAYFNGLTESKDLVTSFGAIPDGSGFYLVTGGEPNESQRSDFVRAAASSKVERVVVLADSAPLPGQQLLDDNRAEDSSPYFGGMGYAAASGASDTTVGICSAAFTFRTDSVKYLLTAGHCFPKGTSEDRAYAWSTYPSALGEYAASFGGKTSWGSNGVSIQVNGQYRGDVGLINVETVGKAAYAQLWTGGRYGTSNIQVLGRQAPAVGNYICGGGVSSGRFGCAGNLQIKGVNEDFTSNGVIYLRNGDRARGDTYAECSAQGDSGGSIYVGNTAIGVISGHTDQASGNCQQRFTGAEEAIQAWGGVVLGE